MSSTLRFLLQRLAEPSTMAGFGVLAVLFGIPQFKVDAVVQVVGTVAATAAVFLPESKPATVPPGLPEG